jgi:hypothetical protein
LRRAGNRTEAGIRQTLRADARPVLCEETEQNDEREENRVQNIIGLIRSRRARASRARSRHLGRDHWRARGDRQRPSVEGRRVAGRRTNALGRLGLKVKSGIVGKDAGLLMANKSEKPTKALRGREAAQHGVTFCQGFSARATFVPMEQASRGGQD